MAIPGGSVSPIGPLLDRSDNPEIAVLQQSLAAALDELYRAVSEISRLAPRDSRIQKQHVDGDETLVIADGEEWLAASPTTIDGTLSVESGGQFVQIDTLAPVPVGSWQPQITNYKTTDHRAVDNEVVLVDTSAGGVVVVYLPSPAVANQIIYVKHAVSGGTCQVNGDGATIDGWTELNITTPFAGVQVISDGTNWWII